MSELIVKDNALMNASYNLDLVEQRLLLLAIIEARESGKGINANDPLEVHAESYMRQFGVHRNTAYQALKDACKNLFHRQFSYVEVNQRGNLRNVTSRWVSQVAYNDNEATVDLIFAPVVVPLITQLEEQFTRYDIEQVSRLSSAYAVRLYELLICWRSKQETPILPIEELRKRLGVLDGEYQRVERFKSGVLHLSINQINTYTDITVAYEQHKKGRMIVGFSFTFSFKKSEKTKESSRSVEKKAVSSPSEKLILANQPKDNRPQTQPKLPLVGFSGLEKALFQGLKKKCPSITEQYILDLAKHDGVEAFSVLQTMDKAFFGVDCFELE